MNKVAQGFKYFATSIAHVKQGAASTEEKMALSALILALAVLVVVVATIRYWIVPLLGIMFFMYLIVEGRRPVPQAQTFNLYDSAAKELYKVMAEVHDRIDCSRPLDMQDIVPKEWLLIRNGIEFMTIKAVKLRRGKCMQEDLNIFRKIIQARINERLRGGLVANIPGIVYNGNAPIFWVDRAYDDMTCLYIDVLIVDNDPKYQYFVNSQFASAKPPQPESDDPTDEDF